MQHALRFDPNRIAAWKLLGNFAHTRADFTSAYWATRQAYELDTYHEHAHELLTRLFATAFELGDDAGAEEWCAKLRHHFHGAPTAVQCALARIAWRDHLEPADVNAGWAVVQELNASRSAALILPQLEMMVASILASANLPDSAEAVIRRARERGEADQELLLFEAHARARLGQPDSAAALLGAYVGRDPVRRSHVLRSRRFEALAGMPAMVAAVSTVGHDLQDR